MHELQNDTDVVWKERHELLEDIRRMSGDLVNLANAAGTRIKGEAEAETQEVAPPPQS